jgi:hypothetical protein
MFFMATNTFVIGPRFDIPGGWPPLPARQDKVRQMRQRLEENWRKRQQQQAAESQGDEDSAEEGSETDAESPEASQDAEEDAE